MVRPFTMSTTSHDVYIILWICYQELAGGYRRSNTSLVMSVEEIVVN